MWAAILNVLIGLWVIAAPDLFEFGKTPANTHYIVGPLVITIAVVSIWEVNRSFRYFNVLAGLWLAISAIFLSYESSSEIANSFVSGIFLILFSLVKGEKKHRYGGGW